MFKTRNKTPEGWKAVSAALSSLMDEAVFTVNKEGVSLRAMDASHIAMIDIFMPAELFESYECDSPGKFAIRLADFSKVLKRADKKDAIELSIIDSLLSVDIKGSYVKNFKQKLIESAASDTPLPKLDHNAKIALSFATLDNILADLLVSGEYIKFETENGLICRTRGDTGEGKVTLDKETGLLLFEVKEKSTATYSIDYMQKFVKSLVGCEKFTLEYSTKMPIRIQGAVDQAKITFFLAPRVQD